MLPEARTACCFSESRVTISRSASHESSPPRASKSSLFCQCVEGGGGWGGGPESGVIWDWFWQLSPTAPRACLPRPCFGSSGLVLNLQKTGLFAYLHKLRICKTTPRFPRRHPPHLQQDDHDVQLELSSPPSLWEDGDCPICTLENALFLKAARNAPTIRTF